jgi:hypothetical protein
LPHLSTNQEHTMHQVAKIAAIAYLTVVIAKRLPVLKDYI